MDRVAKDLDEVLSGDAAQSVVTDELVTTLCNGCIDKAGVTASDGIANIDLLTTNADLPVPRQVRLHVGTICNLCLQESCTFGDNLPNLRRRVVSPNCSETTGCPLLLRRCW